ncbi:MAG: bifunctional demethylmenaquinone methyltransferase/2-methoxy-6-polyprenyl-1,4-benzoquinol methylase UbiE [Acidobacteria bacterium]|nr:bifunctional demethylmenaquinone methyltransferase/2-methoxy-6-polyprenyl-1,4-benzoquinol methylase UbiE [Acidobacteriota bacterium]
MFASIAPRYDLLNHFLSMSIDQSWRRRLLDQLNGLGPSRRILDVCTGTGDLAIELSRKGKVIAVDFCHPMLVIARDKVRSRKLADKMRLAEGDALCLPFLADSFEAVTVAFGVRNLENLPQGLREFMRVLRPGGLLAILEFSKPVVPVFRELFQLYLKHIVPVIGRTISRVNGPYRYLAESVTEFPDQQGLRRVLEECGFQRVKYTNLSGGIAALHSARKPM